MAYMCGQPGPARGAQYAQASAGYPHVQRGAGGYAPVRGQPGPSRSISKCTGGITGTRAAVGGGAQPVYMSVPSVAAQQGNRRIVSPVSAAPSAQIEILPGLAHAPLTETAAPYLREYFEQCVNIIQSTDLMGLGCAAMAGDTQMVDELKQRSLAWHETAGRGLLVQFFQRHDLNKDDVLDTDEARAFFQHLIEEQSLYSTAVATCMIMQCARAMTKTMAPMIPPEQKQEAQLLMSVAITQAVQAVQKHFESQV